MSKPTLVISCPIDTYSGYGARARDVVRALIELDKYDISILGQRWGNTRFGYLEDHNEHDMKSRVISQLNSKPDIWIQVSVPNEFQKVGTFNIGITAGIETTLCDPSWLEGINRMDLLLVSSNHSKNVFTQTKYDIQHKQTNQKSGELVATVPIEVLFEGGDVTKYFPKNSSSIDLSSIKESFLFLFVGHWLQGAIGEDRKNVGWMIKAFCETFKNKMNAPALLLKAQSAGSSIMDRERMLDKIEDIRRSVKGKCPNVYLMHGEVSDSEMNDLYNHSKVKSMISFTKGEGFGRPLLEFSFVKKPIIASGWSGHMDFLDKDLTYVIGGELKKVHKSAIQKNVIVEDSSWFNPNEQEAAKAIKMIHKHYKATLINAKKQGTYNRKHFSLEAMKNLLGDILDKSLPDFPNQIALTLPKLDLPKLEKINE